MTQTLLRDGYPAFLKELKQRIRDAHLHASVVAHDLISIGATANRTSLAQSKGGRENG